MIEVLLAVRENQLKENSAIPTGLNLVHENNQHTHMIRLDAYEPKSILHAFKYDEKCEEHEEKYNVIREIFFHKSSDDENKSNSSVSKDKDDGKEDNVDEEKKEKQQKIIGGTETNLVTLCRIINSTIQSSIGAPECANELIKMNLEEIMSNDC